MIGGASIGLGLGTLGITGGLLGGLVGGPIGGALMGLASSTILKTKMFQKFLFGDEEKGQRGLVNIAKGWFSKIGVAFQGADKAGAKLAGMAALGVGAGALTGTMLSNVGLLGITLGPLGPIGGALVGLGAAMLAQKDNFKEWLFGSEDEEGNRKEGILGQFKNMLSVNVFGPIVDTAKSIGRDFKTFLEYDVLDKFKLVIEPIGDMVFGGISKFAGRALGSFKDLATYIKDDFLKDAVAKLGGLLAPITDVARATASAIYGLGKRIVTLPLDVVGLMVSPVAQAIGKVTSTVAGVVGTALNYAVLKPIQIGFSLAGKVLQGAIKIVSKPFEIIGNTVERLHSFLLRTGLRVSKFFHQITTDFRDAVKGVYDKTVGKFFDFVVQTANNVKTAVVDGVVRPIKDLAVSTIRGIGEAIKESTRNFFKTLFKPFVAVGKGILKAFGIGKKKSGEGETTEGGGLLAYLKRTWEKAGDIKSRTDFSAVDPEDRSFASRWRAWKIRRKEAYGENKVLKDEEKLRRKNRKLIAKYTGNQKTEDTEENRRLAELMAGKSIPWHKVDPIQTATEKTADNTRSIKDRVDDLYEFLTGKRAPGRPKKKLTKEEKQEQNQEHFNLGVGVGDTVTGITWKDASNKSKRKYHRQVSENVTSDYDQNINQIGLLGGTARNISLTGQRIKGVFSSIFGKKKPEDSGEEAPANARGIFGTKGGPTIVGEEGPEAIYESGADHGYIVGKHGPEVVDLPKGANIIPNHKFFGKGTKIPAYAEGTIEYAEGNEEDESFAVLDNNAILKTQDETKLGFPNRILAELLKIRLGVERIVDGFVRNPTYSQFFGKDEEYDEDTDQPTNEMITLPEGPFGPPVPSIVQKSDEEIKAEKDKKAEEKRAENDAAIVAVTGRTGEKLREQLALEAEKEEKKSWRQKLLDRLTGVFKVNKEHCDLWNSIFGNSYVDNCNNNKN